MENKDTGQPARKVSRREFLKGAAAVAGTAVLGGLTEQLALAQAAGTETPIATGTPTAKASASVPARKPAAVGTAQANVATREAQYEEAKKVATEEAAVHARETAVEGKFKALTPRATPSITPSSTPSNIPVPTSTPDALATAVAREKTAVEIVADRKETAIAKTPSATPVPIAPPAPGGGMEPQDLENAARTVAVPAAALAASGVVAYAAYRRRSGIRNLAGRAWNRIRHPHGGGTGATGAGGTGGGTTSPPPGAGTPPAGSPATTP